MIGLSAFLTFLCLFGSAFATKVYQLFLLQGVFLGLAQGLSMPLYIALPSRWVSVSCNNLLSDWLKGYCSSTRNGASQVALPLPALVLEEVSIRST